MVLQNCISPRRKTDSPLYLQAYSTPKREGEEGERRFHLSPPSYACILQWYFWTCTTVAQILNGNSIFGSSGEACFIPILLFESYRYINIKAIWQVTNSGFLKRRKKINLKYITILAYKPTHFTWPVRHTVKGSAKPFILAGDGPGSCHGYNSWPFCCHHLRSWSLCISVIPSIITSKST